MTTQHRNPPTHSSSQPIKLRKRKFSFCFGQNPTFQAHKIRTSWGSTSKWKLETTFLLSNFFKKQTSGNQTALILAAVPCGCLVKKLAQRMFFGVLLHKQKPVFLLKNGSNQLSHQSCQTLIAATKNTLGTQ